MRRKPAPVLWMHAKGMTAGVIPKSKAVAAAQRATHEAMRALAVAELQRRGKLP